MLREAVALAEAAVSVAEQGNPNLINDAIACVELSQAAGRVARLNARVNQRKADREDFQELLDRLDAAASRARARGG